MRGFILRVIINAIIIWVLASGILPGIRVIGSNSVLVFAAVGLIFGVVNGLVKPLVNLLTCALTLLTFGLFRLIVNGAMLLLTAYLSQLLETTIGGRLVVDNLLWAIVGAILAAVIGLVLERVLGLDDDRDRMPRDNW
ncbi:MAG: phage holin family protein [Chloroflexota bacterium]|nr:phage holin family protein [Chloroflexota bacterium]